MPAHPMFDQFTDGYMDGRDLDMPEPGPNRSAQYRHGFQIGRNDRNHTSGVGAARNRELAAQEIARDDGR